MYESFFGLKERPFGLTPDPRYFYLSEGHREALAALVYGVQTSAGLMTLTGPVGAGKTMILASFMEQIRENAENASFCGRLSESRIAFLKDLCRAFGISPEQDSLAGVSETIRDFAIRRVAQGRSMVVLVDEAQDLGPEELEHFHHLSNLETSRTKLLQIVLAGTEKLDAKLRDSSLEALWQRVAIRCAIKPIVPEETIEYIFHRLRVAGGTASGLFTEVALWRIANFARGVPRLLNLVCNQAMISAYSSGRLPVDEAAVMEALQELDRGREGIDAEEYVRREEVGGMVRALHRERPEGGTRPEAENRDAASGRQESQGEPGASADPAAAVASKRPSGILSRLLPGNKLAFGLILVISLAMVGAVMGVGLLKARNGASELVEPGLPQGSEPDSEGDAPGESSPWQERPIEGPPQTEAGSARDEVGSEAQVFEVSGIAGVPSGEEGAGGPVGNVLREPNPQVGDWNDVAGDVQLVLPDVPKTTNGGTDFYTVQVGAFRREEGAQERASELAAREARNLLLLKGGKDGQLTLVCAGVFESERQALAGAQRIRQWGYEDAFPVRIMGKGPADLLRPHVTQGAKYKPREERQEDGLALTDQAQP